MEKRSISSANDGAGAWEEIPFTNLGNGIIVISVDHTSYLRRKFYSLKTGFITIVGCHERTLEKVIYREV